MVVGVRGERRGDQNNCFTAVSVFTCTSLYPDYPVHGHSKSLIRYTEPGQEYSYWLDDCNSFTTSVHQEFTADSFRIYAFVLMVD